MARVLLLCTLMCGASLAGASPGLQRPLPEPLWTHSSPGSRAAQVAFSPDGRLVAHATADISLRDAGDGRVARVLEHGLSNGGGVVSMAFSPDGSVLLSGDTSGCTRLWRVKDGRLLHALRSAGHAVVFAPDGRSFATGFKGGKVRSWNTGSATPRETYEVRLGGMSPVAFSPDGKLLACAGKGVTLRRVGSGRAVETYRGDGWVHAVAFSPEGDTLAVTGANWIRVWNLKNGTPVGQLATPGFERIAATAFSPAGDYFAIAGAGPGGGGLLTFWRTRDWTGYRSFHPKGELASVAFSPDGKLLACGWRDGSAAVCRTPLD